MSYGDGGHLLELEREWELQMMGKAKGKGKGQALQAWAKLWQERACVCLPQEEASTIAKKLQAPFSLRVSKK